MVGVTPNAINKDGKHDNTSMTEICFELVEVEKLEEATECRKVAKKELKDWYIRLCKKKG